MADLVESRSYRLSVPERAEILERFFGRGQSFGVIAKGMRRSVETVKSVVMSAEGQAFERAVFEEAAVRARRILVAAAEKAARVWVKQLELAAEGKKAQHAVARDFLTHIRAISVPVSEKDGGGKIVIQIGSGRVEELEPVTVEGEVVSE